MIITSSTLATLNRGFKALYLEAYQGAGQVPKITSYAMRTSSTSAEEIYGWLGSLPGMRKLLGQIQIRNLVDHNYRISNDEYEDTVAVKRKDIERDNFGIYNPLFAAMGITAKMHPDELLFALMLLGFVTPCYTGKNFFDTNHEPQKGKALFSNKGTKKLSGANFEVARANIKSRVNAEGKPMNLGTDLVLVVSPANESLGRQILQADFIQQAVRNFAGNENVGGAAVTNVNKGTARLDVVPLLAANPDAWFLFDLGYSIKPFIYQVEKEIIFSSLTDPNSERLMLQQEFLYQNYGRYNVGFGLPELAYGSTGADAA